MSETLREFKDIESPLSPFGETCVSFRIVAINDVYDIDNFPHFSSAKKIETVGPTLTIATIAGDFLSPSLLSSLDHGQGKVECMNLCGVDFVCFGNHEDDVPLCQLHNRIRQSHFTWINSNMQSLPLPPDIQSLPEYVILEAKNDIQTRRIALLGFNTNDSSLYLPTRFGSCEIEDINTAAASMFARVNELEIVDAIVPLTHQNIPLDRLLAQKNIGFPVIIGGHDHEPYCEVVNGCHVVKSGMDGENILVIDISWASPTQIQPTVSVVLKKATHYPRDPVVEEAVQRLTHISRELVG